MAFHPTERVIEPERLMGEASFSAKLPPAKPKNIERPTREYLISDELEQLTRAARQSGRHGQRDTTLTF